ncbi:DgyrCDS3578 [Dimorphilus gyrociliatus]|uniref:Chromatin accessibility complex protein 1 n=1 Tax=Dimorphilus gyrociliatus TaxID=2664684 RepID=A0A7I8VIR2_9ANNE|nr:DgyrCDS3578 [Dimorphilus gyrociliatus]
MDETKLPNLGVSLFPLSRIRLIMKSSPDVSSISSDSLFLIGKATELFVEHLVEETYTNCPDKQKINYNDFADVVNKNEQLESFLLGLIIYYNMCYGISTLIVFLSVHNRCNTEKIKVQRGPGDKKKDE